METSPTNSAMQATRRTFGVTLPHFGDIATDTISRAAVLAENCGFDAVWVRDHLAAPLTSSGKSTEAVFIDPVVTLATVAALTQRISLGTATLVPHRHPIHAASVLASLQFLAGGDRLIAGFGVGSDNGEFRAIGLGGVDRRELITEYISVLKHLWSGGSSFDGRFYNFQDIVIRPRPARDAIWISYCGTSKAALRRAVECADSWGPAKVPLHIYSSYLDRVQMLADREQRTPIPTAVSSLVALGRNRQDALRGVDLAVRLAGVRKQFPPGPSGKYENVDDLDGIVIAGSSADVAEGVSRYLAAGAQHFVFDLRFQFGKWEDQVQLVAEEVLPRLASCEAAQQ